MLNVTNLIGFGSDIGLFRAGVMSTDTTPTNTNTPTFSDMAAGRGNPSRFMIALFHFRDSFAGTGVALSGAIGGESATEVVATGASSGSAAFCGILSASVPAGNELDVNVNMLNYTGTADVWGCTLVRVNNLGSTTALDTDSDNVFVGSPNGAISLDTTGAKVVAVSVTDRNDDLSARTPYSSSAASTLILGHRTTRGLAFIDISPPGGAVTYSVNSFATANPDVVVGACWG